MKKYWIAFGGWAMKQVLKPVFFLEQDKIWIPVFTKRVPFSKCIIIG